MMLPDFYYWRLLVSDKISLIILSSILLSPSLKLAYMYIKHTGCLRKCFFKNVLRFLPDTNRYITMMIKFFDKLNEQRETSWKVENAQLENFYFPVGKLFFLSWKIKISQ